MEKRFIMGFLLASTFAVAAPEDRFKGASYDGYDKEAIGFYTVFGYSWGRMLGGTYDGYASCIASELRIRPLRGTTISFM